jgi:hypothetical protein
MPSVANTLKHLSGRSLRYALAVLLGFMATVAEVAASTKARSGTILEPASWLAPLVSHGVLPIDTQKFWRSLVVNAPAGATIVAPMDGEVIFAGDLDGTWGSGVVIKHAPSLYSVITAGQLEAFNTSRLSVGAKLKRGEAIGTASASTGVLEWSLFPYVPDAQTASSRLMEPPPPELTADVFKESLSTALTWLTEMGPPLDVMDLIPQGVLHFRMETEFAVKNSLDLQLNSTPVPKSQTGSHQSVLLPGGPAALKTTERGLFGGSSSEEVIWVSGGQVATLNIGRRSNRSVGLLVMNQVAVTEDRFLDLMAKTGGEANWSIGKQSQVASDVDAAERERERQAVRANNLDGMMSELRKAQDQESDKRLAQARLATEQQKEEDRRRTAERERLVQEQLLAETKARSEADVRERLAAETLRRQQQAEDTRLAEERRLASERQKAEQERQAELKRVAEESRISVERERLAQERIAAETKARSDREERERLIAQAREREQEAEAARREVAQMREQLARAAQAAQAEREATKTSYRPGRRRALVIGNDNYTRVPKLEAARADARAMAQALSTVGFEVTQHTDLSERGMKQALREFKARVQGGDEVLFFFAGHGVQIGGINYLLPIDIQGESEEQVRDEAIQLQRVLDDMQERSAGFMLAVVDACRDNPFRTTGRAIGGRGLAPTAAATGQMIIFSAGAGQQALDKLTPSDPAANGVFTRIFLREMLKPGLPVDRVLRNVRQEVVQLARSVGKEQTPALYDQAVGDFYFKP